jgi:riboflavin biosynthesis pyrimidine reductase
LTQSGRKVIVITNGAADRERIRQLEDEVGHVVIAGEHEVTGQGAISALGDLGYRTIYMATGPRVHHLLLAGDALDRLYLTIANRLLAGEPFSSLVEGELLRPAVGMKLNALYYDPHALEGLGQQFIVFGA